MIMIWAFDQPKSDIYAFKVTSRNLARQTIKVVQLFSGCCLLLLTGLYGFANTATAATCDNTAETLSPRSELLLRCKHPSPDIRFEDEHPHFDHTQFVLEPIDIMAPLPDKHALPPLVIDAHVLLVSALYEFGDIDQQSVLTTSLIDDDNDIFAWIEEDLYVMEFFKDIYPVQLIDHTPDRAVSLSVDVKVACICPGDEAPVKWSGTGNLVLDFPVQKGALKSISLTNSSQSRFDGTLDFTIPPASNNLFSSKDAKIQFQIDGGDIYSWNASIKGAVNGTRATGTTGHFAANDYDLETGLIGHFTSPDN